MSDIPVRKLAETIRVPVEVLLKQLHDAGISVSGADASITNEQKLQLLRHMQLGKAEGGAGTANKLTLARRTTSTSEMTLGAGGRGKTVSIEVKRKKSFTTEVGDAKQTEASRNSEAEKAKRAEELARKALEERKAREALLQEAEQKRRQQEAQRRAAVQRTLQSSPAAQGEAQPQKMLVPPTANAGSPTDGQTVPDIAPPHPTTETQPLPEETAVAAEALPAQADTPAPEEAAVPSVKTAMTGTLGMREQRAAVVQAAREEAAAALKRRPSKAKPKPSLAPRQVADSSMAEEDDSLGLGKRFLGAYVEDDDELDKRVGKKSGKPKPAGRHAGEEGVVHNRQGKKKPGSKPAGKPDIRQQAKHGFEKPTAPVIREVEIPTTIIVSDLAQKLAIRATDIIKAMMKMGMMVTINQAIDQETAILVTEELGHKAKPMQEMDDAALLAAVLEEQENARKVQKRPPVVTIMGHVDHGKTSLLDYIRKTRVAAGEAGGITQHIGAYHVETGHGTVTFLDTPGHQAFTKMRARGAQVTDIVVLIVAADDGVMPQTKEAIQHAKAAGVPMVVAINKIDKPTADPDRVLAELSQNDVHTEAWGGDVPVVKVSAKTGQGIDELLETLLLVADLQELTAAVDAPAKGNVIEASVEKGRGAVATVLVRSGTLQRGDLLLCGAEYGRVRAMFDENGRPVKEAGPSIPVSVLGLSGAPEAGDEAIVLNDERKAKEIAELRRQKQRDSRFAAQGGLKLDELFNQMQAGARAQVNLLVKADVQGSVEAIRSELLKLSTEEVEVRMVSSGIGGINESDIDLAAASKAIIVAFNVRADASARKAAADQGVEIRYYSIIYDVINDVKEAMSGLLSPEVREVFVGLAEVRQVFRASGFGQVAGCLVVDGAVRRGLPIRVLRDNVVIFEGELESLRRHRDDVKEVVMGTECGIAVKDYNDVRVGDQIECYERIEVARKI